MRRRLVQFYALLSVLFVFGSRANAQTASPELSVEIAKRTIELAAMRAVPDKIITTLSDKAQLGFTISGGVSLGSYQAGFMYIMSEAVKENSAFLDLKVASGASAGSSNALMSALTTCSEPNPKPMEDLGFKVWTGVGYEDLFDPNQVNESAMFTRDPTTHASENIWDLWKKGFSKECDVVIGVTATRTNAEHISLAPGLSVPSIAEHFTYRIRGRGYGVQPEVTNYVDHRSRLSRPLLPFKSGLDIPSSRHNFEVVSQTLNASMAFPIAFRPQTIKYCRTQANQAAGSTDPLTCTVTTEEADFIDGGVFDNNPLRLAHEMERFGLRATADGHVIWRNPVLSADQDTLPLFDNIFYLYVDPDTLAYPQPIKPQRAQEHLEVVSTTVNLAGEFVDSARSRELYALMAENTNLGDRMRLTEVHFPASSEHLGAFIGLFESDFRVFDYYLGMYDASVDIRKFAQDIQKPLTFEKTLPFREGSDIPAQWKPFACMIGYFEPAHEHLQDECKDPALKNFRILLQVSIDRLYNRCSKLQPEQLDEVNHYHCLRAAQGHAPPHVQGIKPPESSNDWKMLKGEDEFDLSMRLMEQFEFHYKDLGLEPDEASKGRVTIRRKLLRMIEYLADAQPTQADRAAVLTLGRSTVNEIEYEPPHEWVYFLVGSTTAIGATTTPFDWSGSAWLKLNTALGFKNLFSLFSLNASELQITPRIGPELQLLFLTNPFIQPILGTRVGYQLSTRDSFHLEACDEAHTGGDRALCSQPFIDVYMVIAALERIRFQATLEFFPVDFEVGRENIELHIGIGGHFF